MRKRGAYHEQADMRIYMRRIGYGGKPEDLSAHLRTKGFGCPLLPSTQWPIAPPYDCSRQPITFRVCQAPLQSSAVHGSTLLTLRCAPLQWHLSSTSLYSKLNFTVKEVSMVLRGSTSGVGTARPKKTRSKRSAKAAAGKSKGVKKAQPKKTPSKRRAKVAVGNSKGVGSGRPKKDLKKCHAMVLPGSPNSVETAQPHKKATKQCAHVSAWSEQDIR